MSRYVVVVDGRQHNFSVGNLGDAVKFFRVVRVSETSARFYAVDRMGNWRDWSCDA